MCSIVYEKHPLMQFTFSTDSRTKKQPASAAVPRASETYPAGSCSSSGAEKTVEDLVRRAPRARDRELCARLRGTADLEDRPPVDGNRSMISEWACLTRPYRMFADSLPVLDRKLDEHYGALKGATVQESLVSVATTG